METGPGRAGWTNSPASPDGTPPGPATDPAASAPVPSPPPANQVTPPTAPPAPDSAAPPTVSLPPPPSLDATRPAGAATARERERLGLVEVRTRAWPAAAAARGLALFCGAFTILDLIGALRTPGFDENIWWIDLHQLPRAPAHVLLAAAAVVLVAYAARPRMSRWRRAVTLGLVALCALATAWNGVDFYIEWSRGVFRPGVPLPLSFVWCAGFLFIFWAALRPPAVESRRLPAAAVLAGTAAACVVLFPLAQEFFFGDTDYLGGPSSRPADAVVVFGAEVHADGQPSFVLMDRMDTAIGLYRSGRARRIVVSGAVGASGYNEALVMRDMAVTAGVPRKDVVVDSAGVNTEATVKGTVPFFGGVGWRRIAAESDFYHLPRIKLAYARAGWNVLTVPARSTHNIPQTPFLVLREVPAFWVYYLRAIGG